MRKLAADPMLEGISHVVIDEVHEREIRCDFLLLILRDLLVKRPDLRVVLMSATLDADMFAGCLSTEEEEKEEEEEEEERPPVLHIPGRTFPVTRISLEGIIEMLRYKPTPEVLRGDL